MMDWLGKALQLPEEFLSGGKGGGVIQVKITGNLQGGGRGLSYSGVNPHFTQVKS